MISSTSSLTHKKMIKERRGAAVPLLLLLLLVLLFWATAVTSTSPAIALPGCLETCGNVSIPYPFGIGEECYMDHWYKITCNGTGAFLDALNAEILTNISRYGYLGISGKYVSDCYDSQGVSLANPIDAFGWINLRGSPFTYSTFNRFTAIGCGTFTFNGDSNVQRVESKCTSFCDNTTRVEEVSCPGSACCQVTIPTGLQTFKSSLETRYNQTNASEYWEYNRCSYAFLSSTFNFNVSDLITNGTFDITQIPVELIWTIDSASYAPRPNTDCYNYTNDPEYQCICNRGYGGNPYLPQGCEDINECTDSDSDSDDYWESYNRCSVFAKCTNTPGNHSCSCPHGYHGDGEKEGTGCTRDTKSLPVIGLVVGIGLGLLFLIVSSSLSFWALKQRRLIKLKEKFFQQNGGLLLQQQVTSRTGVSEIAKIFTVEDLKTATNNFDESRVLGQGGYGTVYKGILPDKRVVAIKKSKLMDQSQITQFINEVVILSQINHRNVVKLLGCCLETEVPLLVYEFVSNGTLLQRIRNEGNATTISWSNRLKIASETAGALAYLHSAHSIPVLHRDVKSANILLDENYIAKVSDFGASRLVPLDQTQMTTLVQGTLGYLDPECFQTGQLTEKSDVYSFGVVLVELLTGEKTISLERSEEHRSLAMYFISSMKENCLLQILDNRVVNEGDKEHLLVVAELARRCLKLKGEDRPTMKEVAAELDKLIMFQEHSWVQQNYEETENLLGEPSNPTTSYLTGQYSVGNDFMQPLEIAR